MVFAEFKQSKVRNFAVFTTFIVSNFAVFKGDDGETQQERVYTVEGRERLIGGSWGPTNANSH